MIIHQLEKKKLIHPPKWLADNTIFLTIMGSECYGCSSGNSDRDIYGITIPTKELIFPHLNGEIFGFGTQVERFNQWQEHGIKDDEYEYDFSVYSIVQYFNLLMGNNPNIVDSIFVPERCILHCNESARLIRERRKEFLCKVYFHKTKGYAYSQLHKIRSKEAPIGKRKELVDKFGFDTKFAYHVVRLLNQAEMVMSEGDLDLERNREQLKSIRRGEWTLDQITEYFERKEKELETLYTTSTLQHSPDEESIKQLLLDILESHYGSLEKAITIPNQERKVLEEIETLIAKYRGRQSE